MPAPDRRHRRPASTILAALLALAFSSGGTARGQGGMGRGGWGMRGGGFLSNAANLRNINNRSSQAARNAYRTRGKLNQRVGGQNSFVNNTRDASFGERYSASTRRSLAEEIARAPSASEPETATATAARVVQPLASFFSAAGALVWPGGAPDEGPLGSQKAAADSAVSAVFVEVKTAGRAPVAQVGDARSALIAYGQPALDFLREHTTPVVVDGFHRFLLGLYDSLGQAALASTTAKPAQAE